MIHVNNFYGHCLVPGRFSGILCQPTRTVLNIKKKACMFHETVPSFVLVVGGWTHDDPSCLVEQFCPDYNEWRAAAHMLNNRGSVAVGTLDGKIYTVGGEDNVRCYSTVER